MITLHDGYHRYDARNAPAQNRKTNDPYYAASQMDSSNAARDTPRACGKESPAMGWGVMWWVEWNGKWRAVCIISHTHTHPTGSPRWGNGCARSEMRDGGAFVRTHLEDGGRALWCSMHLDADCGAEPLLSLCRRKPNCR